MAGKIGFVLLSSRDNPIPSTRISVLNMLPYLRSAGYETHVLHEPAGSTELPDVSGIAERALALGLDIVYFQKVHGESVLEAVGRLAAAGVKTVFGVCDLVENRMAEATDVTITVTDFLRSLYDPSLHHKIFVVHDGIEHPDITVHRYREDRGSRRHPLNAVLVTSSELLTVPVVGHPPAYVRVSIVGRYERRPISESMRRTYWELTSTPGWRAKSAFVVDCLRRDIRKVNWGIHIANEAMASSDIGIIAVDTIHDPLPGTTVSHWQVKSENRLTMKMAMGLPVIASPVPAYEPIVVHGENGFFARNRAEWLSCLADLRDPERRKTVGLNARKTVIGQYSKERQAQRLLAVLEGLKSSSASAIRAR